MRRMVKAILAADLPVITYVAPNGALAGSAATFVTLAAPVNAMAPNTTIGAASIVGGGGEDLPETLSRKITNDAVAQIRSLADEYDRNADWAESAVRDAASLGAEEAVSMELLLAPPNPESADIVAERQRTDPASLTNILALMRRSHDYTIVDMGYAPAST